ncbi:hypothetical protein PRK78_001801 [Emydomyces testavorans]|uniref:Uncharacterized protein n=1 Tax=Emydomyces testavorans TaxID=2070801 RepID=A0AAF0DDK6_9EURO|nr:hypothetical protein PRK78_001801 [Emydomyces testavorans]
MQVINGNLAGRCCVPVKNNKRDNNDRAAAMHLHARSHVVARDDGIESCPQGQVAVPVAAPDYDKQIADLMGKGKGKGGGGGGNPVSGGVDKGNPLALAGAMGILAAAGM